MMARKHGVNKRTSPYHEMHKLMSALATARFASSTSRLLCGCAASHSRRPRFHRAQIQAATRQSATEPAFCPASGAKSRGEKTATTATRLASCGKSRCGGCVRRSPVIAGIVALACRLWHASGVPLACLRHFAAGLPLACRRRATAFVPPRRCKRRAHL